jgi:hypothetical protein
MKKVNLGIYDILKKNEENSLYDILLCKECLCSCLRNNFSRHKKSPKHLSLTSLAKNCPKKEYVDDGEKLIKEHPIFC